MRASENPLPQFMAEFPRLRCLNLININEWQNSEAHVPVHKHPVSIILSDRELEKIDKEP